MPFRQSWMADRGAIAARRAMDWRALIAAASHRLLPIVLAAGIALTLSPARAFAENYPSKPIKLVVPVGPGSAADLRARQIADRLSKALGQPVVIENRPGAGSTIGAAYVAKSAPDGYTLLYGTIGDQAIAPALYPNLPYDPRKDFVPIVQNALIPPILVVNPSLGVSTMKELIALAKAKPGTVTIASWGNGTLPHLLALQLAREAGIQIVHIPYKNAGAALSDVVAGHVAMMFDYTPSSKPFVSAGRLKVLMTVGHKRARILPDVPSAEELGMPAIEHMGWSTILAPAGTSREIVKRLNTELVRIVRSPEIMQIIVDSGGDPDAVGRSPEEVAAFIRREQETLAALVKATGARAE
jgi:tripartite-type tricarboxylate transporter receptor subunit TctC